MHAGTKFISNDGKRIIVEGWCWDLQSNLKVTSEVSRSILNKGGQQYNASMQETTVAAASAIALRNAIFKVIPRIFIEKVYKRAMDIAVNGIQVNNNQEVSSEISFAVKREKTFERLEFYGIKASDVLSYFNKKSIKDIDREDLQTIMGVGTAIKDGYLKPEEAFISQASKSSQIGEIISAKVDTLKNIDESSAAADPILTKQEQQKAAA